MKSSIQIELNLWKEKKIHSKCLQENGKKESLSEVKSLEAATDDDRTKETAES